MPVATLHTELGLILLHKGHIETNQLKLAREVAKTANRDLGLVILDLGYANVKHVTEARAQARGIPFIDVLKHSIDGPLVRRLPEELLRQQHVLPIERTPTGYLFAVAHPDMVIGLLRRFERELGGKITEGLAVSTDIDKVLDKFYGVAAKPAR